MGSRCLRLVALSLSIGACAHGDDPASKASNSSNEDSAVSSEVGGGQGGTPSSSSVGAGGEDMSTGSSGSTGGGGDAAGNATAGGGGETADATGAGGEVFEASGPDGSSTLDANDDVSDATIDRVDSAGSGDASDAASVVDAAPLRPTGVTIGTQITATQVELPSNGGIPFNDACPANQVLVGFQGTIDANTDAGETLIRSVQGVCAPLTVTAMSPYQVKVGTTTALPVRNVTGVVPVTAMCPADEVVVGFSGRTAQFIQSLDFQCAPLVIGGSSPSFTLSIGAASTTNEMGAPSGTTFAAISCPNGQVAVGQAPHAGADIDAFGLTCAVPSLVLQ
jgi:hypothetical protein